MINLSKLYNLNVKNSLKLNGFFKVVFFMNFLELKNVRLHGICSFEKVVQSRFSMQSSLFVNNC